MSGKSIVSIPSKERKALKEFAAYVAGLPPLEEWVNIRQMLDPKNAVDTQLYWGWLGRSLDAFFGDRSDPLENSGLGDTLQAVIQENSTKYILLSAAIFQGEKFLRREARALGIDYPFNTRSDLLKELALEECRADILLLLQDHWESHSERQRNERLRDSQKFLKGEISEAGYAILKERWAKEDSKLHRDDTLISSAKPWTKFCVEVFTKYRQKLPAYEVFLQTLGIPKYGNVKKFAIIDRVFREYPAPRRNKQDKSS